MRKILRIFTVVAAALVMLPAPAMAQGFASTGTRAAGMGGAFVGVADDASAIYWNPAGLAAGAYFSLVVDGGAAEITPDSSALGGDDSNFFLGLAMPALGLGYYRLHTRTAGPPPTLEPFGPSEPPLLTVAPELRVDTLVTHHGGVTLVQSLWPGVAVGTTLKLVRGIATSAFVPARTAEESLESEVADLLGRATNRFDLDVGVMAAGGPLKVGFTLRNATEPGFDTAGLDDELVLERQARAGLSYAVSSAWVAAADFDLMKTRDPFGDRRDIALGVEGRLTPRIHVRSGFSFNTADPDDDDAARRAFSVGGSFAARASVFVDGHFTTGNDRAGSAWGVAARFVY
jgi:hypothetical protein